MRKFAFILPVFLLTGILSAADTPETLKVAVMEFKAMGVAQNVADTISEVVKNELINSKLFTLIERDAMDKVLKEQSLGMSGMVDPNQAAQAGKLMGAKKIIVGSVSALEDQTMVTIRVIDVETGAIEVGDKQTAYSQSDLVSTVEELTRNIASKLVGKEISVNGKTYFASSDSFSEMKVTSVAASKVTISGGSADGIKPGEKLVVFIVKNNGKVQLKALIKVNKVFEDYSICTDNKRLTGMITSSDFVRKIKPGEKL
jgi:TolB-like protein